MKIEIIKDGVLQPFELFIFIALLAFIIFISVLFYVGFDLLLSEFPEVKMVLEKPAPFWSVMLVWLTVSARK